MKIDIIIPFYNGDDYFSDCVSSILNSHTDVHRIYVIDNSTQPTRVADFFKWEPKIIIIRAKPAIGFARACNIGLLYSKNNGGDMAVVLNQDSRLHPGCLQFLQEALQRDERIFAAVPLSMNYELTAISKKTFEKYILPFDHYLQDLVVGNPIRFYPIKNPMHANAACVAFRVAMIDEIGFFDPIFPMYGEDTELFARALFRYRRLMVLAPQARIGHAHSNFSATGREAERMDVLTRYALQLYFIKNPGTSTWTGFRKFATYSVHTYLRAIAGGQLSRIGAYIKSDSKIITFLPAIIKSRRPESLKSRAMKCIQHDINPPV